jgi:hypothetical protein
MRLLLSATVSTVLWSTAACVSEPIIIRPARTEAPAARPADTKVAAEPTGTVDTKVAAGSTDAKAAASAASDDVVIPAGWSLVTSPVGGFRVAFPSSPEVDERMLKSDAGNVRMISYGADPGLGRDSYMMVIVSQYPDGMMRGPPADQVLKAASDGTLAKRKLTLVSEKVVRVDGARGSGVTFPGRDFEATDEAMGLRYSVRLILVHDRMYQIMFASRGEKTEAFQQFLSTFSLQ